MISIRKGEIMPVRKPISAQEEPITSFDEITPEFLEAKERKWENIKLEEITMANLKRVGEEMAATKAAYEKAENECKIRVIRAINSGYDDKKELAEVMGVQTSVITKWLKESKAF